MNGEDSKDAREISTGQTNPVMPGTRSTDPTQPPAVQQVEETERTIEERMSGFERSMIRLTRAGVIVASITFLVFCGQLYEMWDTGKQTDTLVGYANVQAQAAHQIAQASDDFTDSAYWMEENMGDAANAMQDSVDTADRNTKRTIRNAEIAFRSEQRAWVGVQGTTDSKGFTEAEPWQVTVLFFNSGRTPARNVQSSGMYLTSAIPISGPSQQQVSFLTFRSAQSIAPQGFYRQSFGGVPGAEGASLSQISGAQVLISQYAKIKKKQLFLYYFGILKYEDTFGNPHETQFCILLANPDTKEAGMCDGFNDLN